MAESAAVVARTEQRSQPDPREPVGHRPGWVHDLVMEVLAAADVALSPQDVLRRAERSLGRQVAPSSIRNELRRASSRPRANIERVSYGRYRLRQGVDRRRR